MTFFFPEHFCCKRQREKNLFSFPRRVLNVNVIARKRAKVGESMEILEEKFFIKLLLEIGYEDENDEDVMQELILHVIDFHADAEE